MSVSLRVRGCWVVALAALAAALLGFGAEALAQANPFGMRPGGAPPPVSPLPMGGVAGFILAKQAEFYRALAAMIRAAKTDGSASFALLGISFAYGIFHAAGPGHGKAVISSYLVANEETWRRGIVLSFASALLQALVAVAIVAVAAVLLGATAKVMGDTVRMIETASYALIMAVGARLVWVKGRAFLAALKRNTRVPSMMPAAAVAGPGNASVALEDHDHHHHHRRPHSHDGSEHSHEHGHAHSHCGHAHGPDPETVAGPGGWARGLSAIVAVGLRPCSGAIIVLVFALAQGLFWVGVASTFVMGLGTAITVAAIATFAVGARTLAARFANRREGTGGLLLRGLELGAATLVLVFGALLLLGYVASERMFAV
jgi:nickel/cobalt transporter (NicO) family protein